LAGFPAIGALVCVSSPAEGISPAPAVAGFGKDSLNAMVTLV
jgi:hypothetical protein